ncbi:hypothetical protein [Rhizobium alvei]|uniref:Uncharacterized protein n=1 Tax=Rhizobium alvei TaxID=1132659 RepID=A0ABT8YSL2_9HYPH|nr:hypothetical protein [Rhizobium alvei]MDO6966190.1 hypothetical protein [Rhizobium alvei]
MRFLLRLMSLLFLAAAVMVGVIDSIQSVAGENLQLTTLSSTLFAINPGILPSLQHYTEQNLPNGSWAFLTNWLFLQPGVIVFLLVSLLLWILAYKREPVAGRFAA